MLYVRIRDKEQRITAGPWPTAIALPHLFELRITFTNDTDREVALDVVEVFDEERSMQMFLDCNGDLMPPGATTSLFTDILFGGEIGGTDLVSAGERIGSPPNAWRAAHDRGRVGGD